jgi:DnaJ-class molecular chaperone
MTKIVDPFAYFGVDKDCSDQEVHKAYKQWAKLLHPDKHAHLSRIERNKLEQEFKVIVECYHAILAINKSKRGDHATLKDASVNKPIDISSIIDHDSPYNDSQPVEMTSNRYRSIDEYKNATFTSERKLKSFDVEKFNRLFEKKKIEPEAKTQLIRKTTDGFNAYNSSDFDSFVSLQNE